MYPTSRRPVGKWRTFLAASVLLGASGCLGMMHPINPPTEICPPVVPRLCQQHVYLFFITGLDPLDYANLNGLAEYCHTLGYNNTYVGQMWHTPDFEKEIRRLHEEDKEAHFVLLGFSFGANLVRNIANHVADDDIMIDLLVYFGGNTLKDVPSSQPDNVAKVVNILASGWIWHGATMQRAENIQVIDVWHFGSPTHTQSLEMLTEELTEVAAKVQFLELAPPAPEQLPVSPRPVTPPPPAPEDEWDFLKPTRHLTPLEDRDMND